MRACGLGRDHRLGAIGDAEARRLDHGQVVGAVADGHGLGAARPSGRSSMQRGELGLAAEDRLGNAPPSLPSSTSSGWRGLVEADSAPTGR